MRRTRNIVHQPVPTTEIYKWVCTKLEEEVKEHESSENHGLVPLLAQNIVVVLASECRLMATALTSMKYRIDKKHVNPGNWIVQPQSKTGKERSVTFSLLVKDLGEFIYARQAYLHTRDYKRIAEMILNRALNEWKLKFTERTEDLVRRSLPE